MLKKSIMSVAAVLVAVPLMFSTQSFARCLEEYDQLIPCNESKHEYKLIERAHTTMFTNMPEEEIAEFLYGQLAAKLYRLCVKKVKDENKCEILDETFEYDKRWQEYGEDGNLWETYTGTLMIRYDKADINRADRVFSGYANRDIWNTEGDPSDEFVKGVMTKRVTKNAMDKCIRKSKDPSKCVLQEKTLSYEKRRSYIDKDNGIKKHNFYGEATVVLKE